MTTVLRLGIILSELLKVDCTKWPLRASRLGSTSIAADMSRGRRLEWSVS